MQHGGGARGCRCRALGRQVQQKVGLADPEELHPRTQMRTVDNPRHQYTSALADLDLDNPLEAVGRSTGSQP